MCFSIGSVIAVKASELEVSDGRIVYRRTYKCEDGDVIAIHKSILEKIEGVFVIKIVGAYFFDFISKSEKQRFIQQTKSLKSKIMADSYLKIAMKNIDSYFLNNYCWQIPKTDLLIYDDQIIVPMRNASIVFWERENVPKITDNLEKLSIKNDYDISFYIEQIECVLHEKKEKMMSMLDLTSRIVIPTNLSAHNTYFYINQDDCDFAFVIFALNKSHLYLSPQYNRWGYLYVARNLGDSCSRGLFIYDGKYAGLNPKGDIFVFNQSVVDLCNNIIHSVEGSNFCRKQISNAFLTKQIDVVIFLLTRRYISEHQSYYVRECDFEKEDVYYFLESQAYYSDYWYDKKSGSCYSYLYVGKRKKNEKTIRILLRTTKDQFATYCFYVDVENKDLAVCFLIRYFSMDEIRNKREFFPSDTFLNLFGIISWYKM